MAWLRRRKPYDRTRILAQAARARSKGKSRKAVDLLREVLEHEPRNAELHRRIAPLLATTKQPAQAWRSYQIAVSSLVAAGFLDQAVGVLREAGGCLRRERAVWEALSELELQRERPVDAHRALLDGRRQFRSRRDRAAAILLLLRARKLAPDHFDANYDLAGLLARSGSRARAFGILEELATCCEGRALRRARRRQLTLAPSPTALWRWIRALVGRH